MSESAAQMLCACQPDAADWVLLTCVKLGSCPAAAHAALHS